LPVRFRLQAGQAVPEFQVKIELPCFEGRKALGLCQLISLLRFIPQNNASTLGRAISPPQVGAKAYNLRQRRQRRQRGNRGRRDRRGDKGRAVLPFASQTAESIPQGLNHEWPPDGQLFGTAYATFFTESRRHLARGAQLNRPFVAAHIDYVAFTPGD
jgi:hypothetical protein